MDEDTATRATLRRQIARQELERVRRGELSATTWVQRHAEYLLDTVAAAQEVVVHSYRTTAAATRALHVGGIALDPVKEAILAFKRKTEWAQGRKLKATPARWRHATNLAAVVEAGLIRYFTEVSAALPSHGADEGAVDEGQSRTERREAAQERLRRYKQELERVSEALAKEELAKAETDGTEN